MGFSMSRFRVEHFSKWPGFIAMVVILSPWSGSGFGVNSQEQKISNSVSKHICRQSEQFQESSNIQQPVKGRPENDDAECGWHRWTKCDPGANSDGACPSFTFESCEEEPKKGRSAGAKPQADEPAKCERPLQFPGWDFVTPPNKYPSLVAIHFGIGCYFRACWGAVLNAEWLVVPQTQGCFARFVPFQSDDFHIIAGDRVLFVDEGTEQERKVAEFISHPDFNFENSKHYRANLGLVRLDKPLEFNDDVQPINLTAIKEIGSSSGGPLENLHVATWFGDTSFDAYESKNRTTQVEFPVDFVPDSECYDKFMEGDGASKESLICAGKCLVLGSLFDPGPKQGFLFTVPDSSNPNQAPVPVGIGPVRQFDSNKISPFGVFTDLSFYIPWIEETLKKQKVKVKVKGQGRSGSEGRLAGSSDAPPNKYPSMINIWKNTTSKCRQHHCGATLLSPNWILTAAHCVKDNDTMLYKVIAGDHDQSKMEESQQEVDVEKIIAHEAYNNTNLDNDIALLKLSPAIQINDKVQPAKLPEAGFETQDLAQAVGWGAHEGYEPHILQEVDMPIVPMDECLALTAGTAYPPKREMHICVGDQKVYPCNGDSGSPLYLTDEAGEQTVVGAVSRGLQPAGPGCGSFKAGGVKRTEQVKVKDDEKRLPVLYTKVSNYIDWIQTNSENLSQSPSQIVNK